MSWLSSAWHWYAGYPAPTAGYAATINPVVAALGAAALIWAAVRQAATASKRHTEQTRADRQRRITESFSKAVEQLGSDKIEVRLGGIYGLERISKESDEDYWTVMETLTAFVRERARWKQPEALSTSAERVDKASPDSEQVPTPATDVAAVLSVVRRRAQKSVEREHSQGWLFNFEGADLRGADWTDVHLEGANLSGVNLGRANLSGAHLKGAYLMDAYLHDACVSNAHLEGAYLMGAHLKGAYLNGAYLEAAALMEAHLEGADLTMARLEDAMLTRAHLEGADLLGAHVTGVNLSEAHGSAETRLPNEVERPANWPQEQGDGTVAR